MTDAPDSELAIAYCRKAERPWLRALLALDSALGAAALGVREPMLGRVRLAWWAQRIEEVAAGQKPVEPLLVDLVDADRTRIAPLAEIAHGWSAVVDEAIDESALRLHADSRGGVLFAAVSDSPVTRAAGAAWALSTLAVRRGDAVIRTLAARELGAVDRRTLRRISLSLWTLLLVAQARLESRGGLWLIARLIGGALLRR